MISPSKNSSDEVLPNICSSWQQEIHIIDKEAKHGLIAIWDYSEVIKNAVVSMCGERTQKNTSGPERGQEVKDHPGQPRVETAVEVHKGREV